MWIQAVALAACGAVAGVAVLGCGSDTGARTPAPSSPSRDATLAAAIAKEGCSCPNEACLERARRSLDLLKVKYGGNDELPFDIYEASAPFERCYFDGTKNIVRDFGIATKGFCSCRDPECARSALAELERLEEKYRDAPSRPEDESPLATSAKELASCMREKIGAGPDVASQAETVAQGMCACDSAGCVQRFHDRYMSEVGRYALIHHEADSEDRVRRAESRMCECGLASVMGTVLRDATGGLLGKSSLTVSCTISSRAEPRRFPKRPVR
jgi:hypothetical protein